MRGRRRAKRPPRQYPQQAARWYRWMHSPAARGLAVGLTPAAAIGGFVAPVQMTTSAVASTVTRQVDTGSSHLFHSWSQLTRTDVVVTGGTPGVSHAWQAMATVHGPAAAGQFAGAVADLAAGCAGVHPLTAQLRHYLIQCILAGLGGLDPDNAADILELSMDVADDPRLLPAIRAAKTGFVPELEPMGWLTLTPHGFVVSASHDTSPFLSAGTADDYDLSWLPRNPDGSVTLNLPSDRQTPPAP
jgi:hypothetical protein